MQYELYYISMEVWLFRFRMGMPDTFYFTAEVELQGMFLPGPLYIFPREKYKIKALPANSARRRSGREFCVCIFMKS